MEKGSESMRERLLARLPQPESLAGYREETAGLIARHERALFWERESARAIASTGIGVFLFANSIWARARLDAHATILLDAVSVVLFFAGGLMLLGYWISSNKVDLLKEVKQVQLQVLELQASIKKEGGK
jgi:hypothetical protein